LGDILGKSDAVMPLVAARDMLIALDLASPFDQKVYRAVTKALFLHSPFPPLPVMVTENSISYVSTC